MQLCWVKCRQRAASIYRLAPLQCNLINSTGIHRKTKSLVAAVCPTPLQLCASNLLFFETSTDQMAHLIQSPHILYASVIKASRHLGVLEQIETSLKTAIDIHAPYISYIIMYGTL
jgi:hypothetical protein